MDFKKIIGRKIRIVYMQDFLTYKDREGIITSIDDENRLHGTWGSEPIVPELDSFILLESKEKN